MCVCVLECYAWRLDREVSFGLPAESLLQIVQREGCAAGGILMTSIVSSMIIFLSSSTGSCIIISIIIVIVSSSSCNIIVYISRCVLLNDHLHVSRSAVSVKPLILTLTHMLILLMLLMLLILLMRLILMLIQLILRRQCRATNCKAPSKAGARTAASLPNRWAGQG